MFDRKKLPHDVPVAWVDAANKGIKILKDRRVAVIDANADGYAAFIRTLGFCVLPKPH